MDIAFRCRLQYNSDITKIRKFFEETETIRIGAGKAGLAFFTTSSNDICFYMAIIHKHDIYQLHVDTSTPIWKDGGVIRSLPANPLIAFIKSKEVDDDLQIEMDKGASLLRLSIMDGNNTVRTSTIPLTIPEMIHEYPDMDHANVVIRVNEFKKLCSDMSKIAGDIIIEHQPNAIRLKASTVTSQYGTWDDNAPVETCIVKNAPFLKATKINIGNTKNSQAGIYISPKYPLKFKVKLGIVDFVIFSKVWMTQ